MKARPILTAPDATDSRAAGFSRRGAPPGGRKTARAEARGSPALSSALGISTALLLLGVAACTPASKPLWDRSRPAAAPIADRWPTYAAMLDELLPQMGAADPLARSEPQRQFERICLAAAAPGNQTQRQQLCREICARLGPQTPRPARLWLVHQLERIGGAESVGPLAALLPERDPRVRECARRALQHIPNVAAAGALCWALESADDHAWRIALINAIAAHPQASAYMEVMARAGGHSTFDTLCELARGGDNAVARASIAALARLASDAAVAELRELAAGSGPRRVDAADALLRCAERWLESGRADDAFALCSELYEAELPDTLRLAALHGMACARGSELVPRLLELVCGPDERLAASAASLLEEVPGPEVTAALIDAFHNAPPTGQTLLLRTCAARGDASACDLALRAVESPQGDVRLAALRALQVLGGPEAVLPLAQAAARGSEPERRAARHSLTRLAAAGVDEAILAALQQETDPDLRCELLAAVAARHYRAGVPSLFEATRDEQTSVQVAAFEALGSLAGPDELPQLIDRLAEALVPEVREAADNAVVATALRIEPPDQRARPLLARLAGAEAAFRASLIRVLGRVGGPDALAAIRAACRSDEAEVADAAVRALAAWPDPEVIDDLLAIARASEDEAHRILALRGCVRLVRLPSQRTPTETLTLLEQALAAAQRADEKRLVLAGLAEVPHLAALKLAEAFLDDPELRDEAGISTLSIARSLAATHPRQVREALELVRSAGVGEPVRQKLDELAAFLDRHVGYCAAWLLAGPYTAPDRKPADLFDIAFAPELPAAGEVEWRPLEVNNRDNPWIFDLRRAVGGESRCVYVRTRVWSDTQRDALLEIGSDDAVKVWLNGELVHANLVWRAVAPAQDKVNVVLERGWNELLLKIVQGGGEWGFCAGLRAPDGTALEGIHFQAQ